MEGLAIIYHRDCWKQPVEMSWGGAAPQLEEHDGVLLALQPRLDLLPRGPHLVRPVL